MESDEENGLFRLRQDKLFTTPGWKIQYHQQMIGMIELLLDFQSSSISSDIENKTVCVQAKKNKRWRANMTANRMLVTETVSSIEKTLVKKGIMLALATF